MKKEISPELWALVDEVQKSTAAFGYEMTETDIERIANYCSSAEFPALLSRLKEKALAEDRPLTEVMDEYFGSHLYLDIS